MKENESNKIIIVIKRLLLIITVISVVGELILYPSVSNLVGVMMTIVCFSIFTVYFFKKDVIISSPFSFFMLTSMFLYRYLPLIGTLLEGKPISYGMVNPIKTFFLETLLFLLSCLAFYSCQKRAKRVNILQHYLNIFGFYQKSNDRTIWIIGIFGMIARLITLAMGTIATGNIIGKALNVLFYYMYIPVILFFPCLYKKEYKKAINLKQGWVWIYIFIITVINLATNSRNKLITPFAIILLNMFLAMLIVNTKFVFRAKNVVKGVVILGLGVFLISNISKAMLINRSIRNDISFVELIKNTYSTLISGEIENEWDIYSNKQVVPQTYEEGWTESYIDNFLLNRFCNLRITDETLYLGEKIDKGIDNPMINDFKNRIIAVLPQPIIKILGIDFDKEKYYNSRGDVLYVYSNVGTSWDLGGYRVTSHLGDGITTFGPTYFLLQFIMWYFVMMLLNSFSIYTNENGRVYSIYGLLTVYSSLLMFGNANGMIDDVLYLLRGYWQGILMFVIIYKFFKTMSLLKINK